MQNEQNALNWFMQMVEKGAINPLYPDLSLVPDNVMSQLQWKARPDRDVLITQTSATVAHFLFIACKIALQKRQGEKIPAPFTVTANEVFRVQDHFLLLVSLESLKRAGIIKYQTKGSWHDKDAEIIISRLHPAPEGYAMSPIPGKSFKLH